MNLHDDPLFYRLLADSYTACTGEHLAPADMPDEAAAKWLYEDAPFGILAHDATADPVFIYGNKTAQKRFEYNWDELTRLPSRLSAEAPNREERQRFIERVQRDGFATGYKGMRVTKSGARFWIEDATLWQLVDKQGIYHGQAVIIPKSVDA
jgi:hypothetical protein